VPEVENQPEPGAGLPPAPPTLKFPDLPRLELDQLLTQLVDRAQEVMATQGRLRGLLQANQLIIGDLALETLLHRIIEAARELVGARYAALGVIASSGGLAAFVHTGMPDGAVELIGHLPEGKGLLGALIEDPQPIRLERIRDDPRSIGFPPGHPAMETFLGAPIEVRGEVYGNLYLTESTKGGFSAEDEELARALAATAGLAIANARLYESARSRGEWLQASELISRKLLSGDRGDAGPPLRLIAEQSLRVARADLVTVSVPEDGDELRVRVAVGVGAMALEGRRLPREGTVTGRVLADGVPISVGDPGEMGLGTTASDEVDVGPVMVVPLAGSAQMHGALSVCRLRGRTAFTQEDRDLATSFASQAAVAVELAQARADQQRAAMLEDRERIAEDLHDHVIQKLFAAGMTLQAVAAVLPPGRACDRVLTVIDDLDETISQIRTTIFQLQRTRPFQHSGVRARLLDVASQAAPSLGMEPAVRFSGVMDTLRGNLVDDLVAVLREALSNVRRHAQAGSVDVDVAVRPDRVILDVRDDGCGPPNDAAPGTGLTNLRTRAQRRGGSLTFGPGEGSGSWLRWSVPIRHEDA
jgi:signal transduction histidine kinase